MTIHRRFLAALGIVALSLSLSASPASAEGRGSGHGPKHKHHKVHKQRVRHDVVVRDVHRSRPVYRTVYRERPVYRTVVRERHFAVPRHIVHHDVYRYDPYYAGSAYFAPHRHAHVVYAFPVYTAYDVSYEPHYYCDDELYVERAGRYYDDRYSHRRPRVSIGVNVQF